MQRVRIVLSGLWSELVISCLARGLGGVGTLRSECDLTEWPPPPSKCLLENVFPRTGTDDNVAETPVGVQVFKETAREREGERAESGTSWRAEINQAKEKRFNQGKRSWRKVRVRPGEVPTLSLDLCTGLIECVQRCHRVCQATPLPLQTSSLFRGALGSHRPRLPSFLLLLQLLLAGLSRRPLRLPGEGESTRATAPTGESAQLTCAVWRAQKHTFPILDRKKHRTQDHVITWYFHKIKWLFYVITWKYIYWNNVIVFTK